MPDSTERRQRDRHPDSDSGSSGVSSGTNHRSLRKEEKPRTQGLQPPPGANPQKTARDHVAAGTRAKEKSSFVSSTKSRRSAVAWAASNPGGKGRVASITASSSDLDISTPRGTKKHLGTSEGTMANSAMASKEVLSHGGVPASRIKTVQDVQRVPPSVAREARAKLKKGEPVKHDDKPVVHAQVSRAQATKSKKKLKPHGALVFEEQPQAGSSKRPRSPQSSTSSLGSSSSSPSTSKPPRKKGPTH